MTKITLTRMCELAAQKGARDAQARIEALEAGIIAALRARDEDRGDILRKALHGGGE